MLRSRTFSGGGLRLIPLINRTRRLLSAAPLSAAARRAIVDLNFPLGEQADNYTSLVLQELIRTVAEWLCAPFFLIVMLTGTRLYHFWYRIETLQHWYWRQRQCCVEEAVGAIIDLPFYLLGLPPLLSMYRSK